MTGQRLIEQTMKNKLRTIFCIAGLLLLAGSAFAGASMKAADEAPEPALDLKKKKAGEECKVSDECQKHHACTKSGEKNVCTAPPRPQLPPGVVT